MDRFTVFSILGLGVLPVVLLCFIGWWVNDTIPDYPKGTRYIHKNTQKEKYSIES